MVPKILSSPGGTCGTDKYCLVPV